MPYLHWPAATFLTFPSSDVSAFISVFIFVTWARWEWNCMWSLSKSTTVSFYADTVAGEKKRGHCEHLEPRCSAVCQHGFSGLLHCGSDCVALHEPVCVSHDNYSQKHLPVHNVSASYSFVHRMCAHLVQTWRISSVCHYFAFTVL